eukprot:maker-scaffold1031_size68893-snap-gene-0.23 protein:Tk03999 transcript:maker-scaffold1031_size68893-snap-gene-0.23-mRNA-1 annotation:"---NA---"
MSSSSGSPPLKVTFDLPAEATTNPQDWAELIQSQAKILQELGILSLQIQGQEVRSPRPTQPPARAVQEPDAFSLLQVLTVARPARSSGHAPAGRSERHHHGPDHTRKNSLLVNLLSHPAASGSDEAGARTTSLVNPNTGELEAAAQWPQAVHGGRTPGYSSRGHGSAYHDEAGKKVKLKLRLPVEKRNLSSAGLTAGHEAETKAAPVEPKLPKLILSMRDKTVKLAGAAAAAAAAAAASSSSSSHPDPSSMAHLPPGARASPVPEKATSHTLPARALAASPSQIALTPATASSSTVSNGHSKDGLSTHSLHHGDVISQSPVSSASSELTAGLDVSTVASSASSVTLINLPYSNTSCEDSGIESNDTLSDKSPGHISDLVRSEDCLSSPSNYVTTTTVITTAGSLPRSTSHSTNGGHHGLHGSSGSSGEPLPTNSPAPGSTPTTFDFSHDGTAFNEAATSEKANSAPGSASVVQRSSTPSTQTTPTISSNSTTTPMQPQTSQPSTDSNLVAGQSHGATNGGAPAAPLTNGVSSAGLRRGSSSDSSVLVSSSGTSISTTNSSTSSRPPIASTTASSASASSAPPPSVLTSSNSSTPSMPLGTPRQPNSLMSGQANSKMVPVKLVTVSGEGNMRLVRVSPVKSGPSGAPTEPQCTKTVFIKSVAPKLNGSITLQSGGGNGGMGMSGKGDAQNQTVSSSTTSNSSSSDLLHNSMAPTALTNGVGGLDIHATGSSTAATTIMTLARNGGLPKSTTLTEVKATKRPASEMPTVGVPNSKLIKVSMANSSTEHDSSVNNTLVDHNSKDSGSLDSGERTASTRLGNQSTVRRMMPSKTESFVMRPRPLIATSSDNRKHPNVWRVAPVETPSSNLEPRL